MDDSTIDNEGMMLPPWLKFPDIPLGSSGWRMGSGETYWYEFVDWFSTHDREYQDKYKVKYPKPERWKSFWPYTPEMLDKFINEQA